MKIIHLSFLMLFFFTVPDFVYSQNLKENELVVIQGEKFILHQVRTGETIYSICRDFKIDSSQLQKHNPSISKGLSIGETLKIPFNENVDLSQIPTYKKGDPTGFANYTVDSRNETAYSISKKFGITVEEVYAYNPTATKFKKGMTVKIPQWNFESKPVEIQNEQQKTEPVQSGVTVQNSKQNDLVEHTVVSGETLYSIGKKYQVTESEILYYNPDAKNLKAGSKLYLPQKTVSNTSSAGKNQGNFKLHTIASGETLYRITKMYNVSEDELIAANPELKTGFRAGTVIRIPQNDNIAVQAQPGDVSKNEVQENSNFDSNLVLSNNVPADCQPKTGEPGKTTVALFLPLFLDSNEQLNKEISETEPDTLEQIETIEELSADTIIEEEKPVQLFKQFYGNSENFLQFYEGVLIAVDSMQKAGMDVVLNVYDTKDNPGTIRKVINEEAFLSTDLIIGPVYENVQKEVAQIAEANHIPIISPFTPKSAIINGNTQFYQINPTREYLAEATAEMIAKNYSNTNFIVVRTSAYEGTPEGQLVEMIKNRIASSGNSKGKFTVYDFKTQRSRGLPDILSTEMENVVFIPSPDEGELSVAISNINNLAKDFSITLVGAGNYQQKYPSIEIAHYHNLKFKYINPYWIDYQKASTINFIEKFIANFGTEPNSYGVQGFDVSWYFLNALFYYGKDFENCLPYMKTELLQGNYYFKKVSQSGGFMNEGVSVISYNRDFDVESKGVIGKP